MKFPIGEPLRELHPKCVKFFSGPNKCRAKKLQTKPALAKACPVRRDTGGNAPGILLTQSHAEVRGEDKRASSAWQSDRILTRGNDLPKCARVKLTGRCQASRTEIGREMNGKGTKSLLQITHPLPFIRLPSPPEHSIAAFAESRVTSDRARLLIFPTTQARLSTGLPWLRIPARRNPGNSHREGF